LITLDRCKYVRVSTYMPDYNDTTREGLTRVDYCRLA